MSNLEELYVPSRYLDKEALMADVRAYSDAALETYVKSLADKFSTNLLNWEARVVDATSDTDPSLTFSEEAGTEAELATLLSALDEAHSAAVGAITALDRLNSKFEGNIRELKNINAHTAWSNHFARERRLEKNL